MRLTLFVYRATYSCIVAYVLRSKLSREEALDSILDKKKSKQDNSVVGARFPHLRVLASFVAASPMSCCHCSRLHMVQSLGRCKRVPGNEARRATNAGTKMRGVRKRQPLGPFRRAQKHGRNGAQGYTQV